MASGHLNQGWFISTIDIGIRGRPHVAVAILTSSEVIHAFNLEHRYLESVELCQFYQMISFVASCIYYEHSGDKRRRAEVSSGESVLNQKLAKRGNVGICAAECSSLCRVLKACATQSGRFCIFRV
jgi:hypothetical protein